MSPVVNSVLTTVNEGIAFFKANSFYIFVLLCVLYSLKNQISKLTARGHTISRSVNKEDDIRQVRMRQQELASQRAAEAAVQRKQKEKEESEPKLEEKKKAAKPQQKLGSGDGGGGYNPMQPWTASSGSGGYRPQRRTVRKG